MNIPLDGIDGSGLSKDQLYAKCLSETLRDRALIASMKNAKRFVPDEVLVSSKKRREAKEAELASQLVPIRRRDRLEELLVLENKKKLREEQRLREERRALGLPEEEFEADDVSSAKSSEHTQPKTPTPQPQEISRSITPASQCSADHDLRDTIRAVEAIVEEEPPMYPNQPLSRTQVLGLRKLVHNQAKKNRQKVEECPNQPHLCPHCFEVNVQAKHLCPTMSGSLAFRKTGKIIDEDKGVKFGMKEYDALPNGEYDDTTQQNVVSNQSRIADYNPHPHGTGVVFLPLTKSDGAGASSNQGTRHQFYGGPKRDPIFNNNIPDGCPAEVDLQYPGSTYNVYDTRDGIYSQKANERTTPAGSDMQVEGHRIIQEEKSTVSSAAPATCECSNKPSAEYLDNFKTTSALWKTTNQDRETDMQRFLEFQKNRMNTNSKQVYGETTSRFPPVAAN